MTRIRLCSYSLAVLCRTDGQTLLLVAILSLPDFSLLVRAEEMARQESASRISGYGFCNDLGHGRHQTPPRMRSDRRPVSESPADCPGRPAQAYTDPGSGLLLWQLIVSGFVGCIVFRFRKTVEFDFQEEIANKTEA